VALRAVAAAAELLGSWAFRRKMEVLGDQIYGVIVLNGR
jgi:hypothetical protein